MESEYVLERLEKILAELKKLNAGLVQLVERSPCKRDVGSAILPSGSINNTESFDPYCHCQDPSCQSMHDYVGMTDIASDIDPEVTNHKPERWVQ